MDGVKQATTLVFVAVYSFNYEMGHDEKETKFLKSRSKYAVSNDLHFTIHSDKLTFDVDGTYEFQFGLGHISTTKHVILPDALVSNTLYSHKTQTMNGLMLHFLEYWNIYWSFYIFRCR